MDVATRRVGSIGQAKKAKVCPAPIQGKEYFLLVARCDKGIHQEDVVKTLGLGSLYRIPDHDSHLPGIPPSSLDP
jgi:hypothetical protein